MICRRGSIGRSAKRTESKKRILLNWRQRTRICTKGNQLKCRLASVQDNISLAFADTPNNSG
jgi:hypothetical protein